MDDNKVEVKFINDENISEDAYLWRYIDLHKFLSFIFTKSIYLTRLDKFEDQKEGISIKHLLLKKIKRELDNAPSLDNFRGIIAIDTLGSQMNQIDDELKLIQEFNFANCWVIGNDKSESVAMWNLYSRPNSLALKIKYTDFKKLLLENGLGYFDSTLEIVCSPVQYIDYQNVTPAIFDARKNDSVFLKDISFEHEKEFRLIAKESPRDRPNINYRKNISKKYIEKFYNETYNYPGISLDLLNFDEYPFEIIYHPKSQDWAKDNIKEIIKLSNLNFTLSNSKLELK